MKIVDGTLANTYLHIWSPKPYHCASGCSCQTTAKLCILCAEHCNVINTVPDPNPNPRGGGQLPSADEHNSTLTSGTRGEALTPNLTSAILH